MINSYVPEELPLHTLDWPSLVPWIGKAHETLARFDERLKKLSSSHLETLKWREAIASLCTQNIRTSLKELLQFSLRREEIAEKRAPLLQKVLNVKEALDFAMRWKGPLNLLFFSRLHAMVKRDALNPKEIGCLRMRQNWIGQKGCTIEEAYFYPPEAKKMPAYLQNLFAYAKAKERDPLVQLAIFFAQFLIIHPFMDGNGRVARIYIPLFLYRKKLISRPYLFMSRYFAKSRSDYFHKLFFISERGEWEEWIIYFLKGIIEQAR